MTNFHLFWNDRSATRKFKTGVSLHSHTSFSEESLDMIPRYTRDVPYLGAAIRRQQALYEEQNGHALDFGRAFWTPPLTPREAIALEKGQIEKELGMAGLVSLSDHDNIRAAASIAMVDDHEPTPISTEWTIPFGTTYFHMGVHNMPAQRAQSIIEDLNAFTKEPKRERLEELLAMLNEIPDVLLILNHPLWDEAGIGTSEHAATLGRLLERFGHHIHALELNGLRSWQENSRVIWLGRQAGMPVISGGDRHGREANAILNVTNAATFEEFISEVRNDKRSEVVFMPQYREPLKMRVLQTMWDIVRDYPEAAEDRRVWSDRVFYRTLEGEVVPLSLYWGKGGPMVVRNFLAAMRLVESRRVRFALRFALADKQEVAL